MIRATKITNKDPQEIAPPIASELLEKEVEVLRAKKTTRLLQHKEYEIF